MGIFTRIKTSYKAGREREEGEQYKRKMRREAAEKKAEADARRNPSGIPYRVGRLAAKAAPVVEGIRTTGQRVVENARKEQRSSQRRSKRRPQRQTTQRDTTPEFFRALQGTPEPAHRASRKRVRRESSRDDTPEFFRRL